jgi:pilus assembly protein CpaB
VFSERILRDVRVLAIGQNIVQGAAGNPRATAAASATLYRTVTLQVSPRGAQKIVVAEQLGSLSLIVRSAHRDRIAGDAPARGPVTLAVAGPAGSVAPVATLSGSEPVFASTVSPVLAQNRHPIGKRMNVIEGSSRQEILLP